MDRAVMSNMYNDENAIQRAPHAAHGGVKPSALPLKANLLANANVTVNTRTYVLAHSSYYQ